jgi:nucleoside-diphosphate kinase
LMHGSDGPDAAKREIEIYFTAAELLSAKQSITPWLAAADEL